MLLRLYQDYVLQGESQSYQAKGGNSVDRLDELLSVLDYALNTTQKRHIVGGILMSMALLFGGLAITVATLKSEEDRNNGE